MNRGAGARFGRRSRRAAPTDPAPAPDQLAQQFRAGDRSAFAELVRLTTPATYTLALRLVADPDDARDVVQETYLRAYRGLRSFRGDAAVTSWLHRITANCASDLLVRRRRQRHDALDEVPEVADLRPDADPALHAAAAALRDDLSAALVELPDALRSVIVLRDVYELSHADVARHLDITETAAKVRLHRARLALRSRMAAAGHEVEEHRRAV